MNKLKIFFGIVSILSGIFFGILCVGMTLSTFVWLPQSIKENEKLLREGDSTIAVLEDEIKKTDIGIRVGSVSVYKVNYLFEVNGKEFSGTYRYNKHDSVPQKQETVYYLPENPEQNGIRLREQIAGDKKSINSGFKYVLIFGLAIASVFSIFRGWKRVKENRKQTGEL